MRSTCRLGARALRPAATKVRGAYRALATPGEWQVAVEGCDICTHGIRRIRRIRTARSSAAWYDGEIWHALIEHFCVPYHHLSRSHWTCPARSAHSCEHARLAASHTGSYDEMWEMSVTECEAHCSARGSECVAYEFARVGQYSRRAHPAIPRVHPAYIPRTPRVHGISMRACAQCTSACGVCGAGAQGVEILVSFACTW